ncbi:MAG: pyridoxamine 5'-phosphate oxidase [Betaproteobacteria bacterium]|nr:pyridoxamine 5'-phosphate oxidase [Betaproteobacteria bacterium]
MAETHPALNEATVEHDPIAQFAQWYDEACAVERPLPHAAALATATRGGSPSVRMVLLKGFDAHGFVFFTNHKSRKGRELGKNARASLLFYWGTLERQVRIEGRVAKVSRRESDDYFRTRPRGSQLSAWASPQSEVLADRADIELRYAAAAEKYPDEVQRPPHWGGYRLVPAAIEFWQGREDRLHDRLRYRRARDGRWRIERLAP